MLAGVLGILGLILAICAGGAFMEGDAKKAAMFGAGLLACSIIIIGWTPRPKYSSGFQDCWTEWDGRTTRTVCD